MALSKNNIDGACEGPLDRMGVSLIGSKVQYTLPVGSHQVDLMPLIGQFIQLSYLGYSICQACGLALKKSYQQGYCYPATQRLASCDLCILKPELCHHHLGTCREPLWGRQHCFQPHRVYLANSSGLKVGITRASTLPTRWLDQGASQAISLLSVSTRRLSGLIEVLLKKHVSDRTAWQQMLKGVPSWEEMCAQRNRLLNLISEDLKEIDVKDIQLLEEPPQAFEYPVLEYPTTVKSLSFDKTPEISGRLLGIKGQYWILETGVLNIRSFTGYQIRLEAQHPLKIQPILRVYPYAQSPLCGAAR